MLPITIATLQFFCRICLRELLTASYKPNHVIEKENIIELLQNIAGISMDTTYKYPKKICHSCYIKMIALDSFRQKYLIRVGVQKLAKMEDLNEAALHGLKAICGVCLRHADDSVKMQENLELLAELEKCNGIHSNNRKEVEYILANASCFPRTLCSKCISKLKTFIAFRTLAQQSDEYSKSLLHDVDHAIEVKNETIYLENLEREGKPFQFNANVESSLSKHENVNKYMDLSQSDNNRKTEAKRDCFDREIETENIVDEPLIPHFEIFEIENNPLYEQKEDISNKISELSNIHEAEDNSVKVKFDSYCRSEKISEENSTKKIKKERTINIKSKNLIVKETGQKSRRSTKYIYCSKCDKQFYKEVILEAHIKSVHEGVDRPFVCDFPNCFNSFRQNSDLVRHRRLLHTRKEPTSTEVDIFALPKPNAHICMTCLRQFKRRDVLYEHINTAHTKSELRPFKCKFCQKGFGSRKTLLRHEKNHSSERPFICEFCPKRYNSKVELSSHLQRHTTVPELLCPICKRGKVNTEELQKHIAMHEASRQHQCPICGRVFTKLFHLREHENAVHFKLRPYKCSHCPKTFATRRTQKEHEELHDPTMRPVFCGLCTMNFRNNSSLTRHMTREHKRSKE